MKHKQKPADELTPDDFRTWRRVTPEETAMYRRALKNTFGFWPPKRGRPAKKPHLKYKDIHIKIHPKALLWAKKRAKQKGVGYQTVINEVLLAEAA